MRIGPSLILASRQTLAMTPQLQQAIKLLQFSHLELAAFIQQELEKNPLLSEGAADDGPIAEADAPVLDAPADTAEALAAAAPALAEADERWTREHADRGGDGAASKGGQREDAPDALDFVAERPRSLAVHVLEQIELMFSDVDERRIALKLAEGLDEAGYCRLDAAVVSEAVCVSLEMVEAVGARLRQIEPAGLFSRTVAECLSAQLAERDRLDPAMKALLDNLDLVAAGELGQLRRRCGVDDEDLRDMLAELRTLDPRPGQAFDYEPIQPVAPDLFLRPAKDADTGEEGWHIELNTDALPKVLVDRNYHATLMKGARAKPDRDFVAERFQSANWLVKTSGAARHHDPESGARDRPPAGRLLPQGRERAPAAGAARYRHRHRAARKHGEPCHIQQVHRHAARHLRAEIFLHLGAAGAHARRGRVV